MKIPNFSGVVQIAITRGILDDVKRFYELYEYIDDDFSIFFVDDIETMELVIRKIAYLDLKYCFLNQTYRILNCPEEKRDFISWMVKLFAYLESITDDPDEEAYFPQEDVYRVFESNHLPIQLDIRNMKFRYDNLKVIFPMEYSNTRTQF